MEHESTERRDAELWSRFFSTDEAPLASPQHRAGISGRTVLVTGAGGWIGSALCASLASHGANHLLLLDLAEGGLYDTHRELTGQSHARITPVLGSVCDEPLLRHILSRFRPEIIYHAAAYKHVPLAEQNPFAALQNNALGTATLTQVAAAYETPRVIVVSTDKAVEPASIMGASKRIGELALFRHNTAGTMRAVRLGNVFGSPGSVAPLFKAQIEHGGPVTVTHPDAQRYFLTLREVTEYLLAALDAPRSCDLLVPEMGDALHVTALARFMIGSREVPVVFGGLRPGDKMEEILVARSESRADRLASGLCCIRSPSLATEELDDALFALQQAIAQRDLDLLIATIQRVAPEYSPSASIREQLTTPSGALR